MARLESALAPVMFALLPALGCGGDPVDVSGEYTLTLTNGDNGCQFENWVEGEVTTNVSLLIEQDGDSVTASVGGAAALVLDVLLGSSVFRGEVDGSHLQLTLHGTDRTVEQCTFFVDGVVHAEVDGDVITGVIEYRPATNGNVACGVLNDCVTSQQFNGTRPPSGD
ncbi:MAG TPA: hypothetical protein VKZ63_05915 [Kofleriaceae bacterium]|nr:hypothetical protein [Kofleriaceae bacterium]